MSGTPQDKDLARKNKYLDKIKFISTRGAVSKKESVPVLKFNN